MDEHLLMPMTSPVSCSSSPWIKDKREYILYYIHLTHIVVLLSHFALIIRSFVFRRQLTTRHPPWSAVEHHGP